MGAQRALAPPGHSDNGGSGTNDPAVAATAARLMALVSQRGAASEDTLLASEVDSACCTAYRQRWSTRSPAPPVHVHTQCLVMLLEAQREGTLSLAECGGMDFLMEHIARLFGHLRAMEKCMRLYPDAVPPGGTGLSHQRFQFVDLHEDTCLWMDKPFVLTLLGVTVEIGEFCEHQLGQQRLPPALAATLAAEGWAEAATARTAAQLFQQELNAPHVWSHVTCCLRARDAINQQHDAAVAAQAAAQQQTEMRRGRRCCSLPACGVTEPSPLTFKKCSGCGQAFYCGREHQAQHWRQGHKRSCGAAGAAAGGAGASGS
jgi:hypothetical protein